MTKFPGGQLPYFSAMPQFLKWYASSFGMQVYFYIMANGHICELMRHHIIGIGISLSIINNYDSYYTNTTISSIITLHMIFMNYGLRKLKLLSTTNVRLDVCI